jgi:2-keto-3-deoxy-L-rhamnonate aldolase RhmA
MLVILMLETPTAVANAFDIASVPGIDVCIIGNGDLSSFSTFPPTDDRYQALVKKVHDDVVRAGKIFGQANWQFSTGPHSYGGQFFQNGPSNDGWTPPASDRGGRGPDAAPAGRGGQGGR